MIEVCVGPISSGKSTYCKQQAAEGWIIMNDDSIVNMLHAGQYTLYQELLKPLYKSIEDHILHTAVAMGKNVVIDRGLDISAEARKRWIVLGKVLDVPVRAVGFQRFAPSVHAQRRFAADSRGHTLAYWTDVAHAHEKRYQPPSVEEGFLEIRFIN